MIKDDLRNPIVKTVLLIVAITLIILFSFNAPPGSGIWGTLTAIISGIFTTIKVVIGLAAAFAISIFLFVLLLALSVAIISRIDAVKIVNALVYRLTGKELLPQPKPRSYPKEKPVVPPEVEEVKEQETAERGVEDKLKDYLDSRIAPLNSAKEKLTNEISSLQSRLGQLTSEIREPKEEPRIVELEENMGELRSDIHSMHQGVGEFK